jgi:aspartate aminotransferase-like enzyme
MAPAISSSSARSARSRIEFSSSPALRRSAVTAFSYPKDALRRFEEFYARRNEKGFAVYPGKRTQAGCFRAGSIDRIDEWNAEALLRAIRETLHETGLSPH